MPGLISSAEAVGVREALDVFMVHTYTRTPLTAGTEDAHGDATQTPGTPVTDVPCKYRPDARIRVRNDEGGVTFVRTPALTVAHDDPLDDTDSVSNIRDSEGTVLLAGPIQVGAPVPSAGLGPLLKKTFVLRGAEVGV